MNVPKIIAAAVFAVAGLAIAVIAATPTEARDCTNNSIIKCGAYTVNEFNTRYAANETKDLPEIYNYFGIDISKIRQSQQGYVTPTGEVKLMNGHRTVATGVETVGRDYKQGSRAVKLRDHGYNVNTTIYVRPNTSNYNANLEAFVVLKADGSFDYAILKECANPVVPPTPEKPKNPGVSIDKLVDGVEHKKVEVNQPFKYQLAVKNTGDVDLKNVTVADGQPANVQFLSADKGTIKGNMWTYVIPVLKKGETQNFTITAKATKEVAGRIVNTACVDAPEIPNKPDFPYGDDCDNATVEVPPKPPVKKIEVCDLTTKKIVTINEKDFDPKKYSKNLDDCKEKPVAKFTCDSLTVTKLERTKFKFDTKYTVENATFKSVTYVVKNGRGAEVYRGPNATFESQATSKYSVQAIVTVTVNGQDKTVIDEKNCKKEFEIVKEKTPAVSIEKTVDGVEHKEVKLNQEFAYNVKVTNTGETNLTNVKVTDPSPANVQFISADKGSIADNKWSYTIPELKIGQSMSFAIKAKVVKEVSGKIVNTACVDAPTVPGTPDDCDDATVEVPPTPVVPPVTPPETPETPPELPKTGITDAVASLIGLGSLIAATTYYIASRRGLNS